MLIKIYGKQIEQVKYTKFLGLYIDNEFSWKNHIDQISTKISKMTGIIARAKHYLSMKGKLTIYKTMIYPYLIYCNMTWASTYPTRLHNQFLDTEKNS